MVHLQYIWARNSDPFLFFISSGLNGAELECTLLMPSQECLSDFWHHETIWPECSHHCLSSFLSPPDKL